MLKEENNPRWCFSCMFHSFMAVFVLSSLAQVACEMSSELIPPW